LITKEYDRIISKKDLMCPLAKDFLNFFSFIIAKIRPDWAFNINKMDEDVISILNELRCPGNISRGHLIAVGAPNTWPHLLAVLAWLVELANYLNLDNCDELANDSIYTKSYFNENLVSIENVNSFYLNETITRHDNILEQNYREFLHEGYKLHNNKGDSFGAIENFRNKTDEIIKFNSINSDRLIKETHNLEKLIEELEKNNPPLTEINLKFELASRDLNLIKKTLIQ
jgi:SMC interacting uncharacterized protein involved in chromosome segregation